MIEFVRYALVAAAAYLGAGMVFAIAFHIRGLAAVDPATHGASLAFRMLITPGVVALWPFLGLSWLRAARAGTVPEAQDPPGRHRQLRSAHALIWKALAVSAPVGIAVAIWYRPTPPASAVPGVPMPPAGLTPTPEPNPGSNRP